MAVSLSEIMRNVGASTRALRGEAAKFVPDEPEAEPTLQGELWNLRASWETWVEAAVIPTAIRGVQALTRLVDRLPR